jgi:hypothetical protein
LPHVSASPISASQGNTRRATPSGGRCTATATRITLVEAIRKISEAHQKSAFPAACMNGK